MIMDKIIQKMKDCGWVEVDGVIENENLLQSFPTWEDAICACIEVASDT
jgi:hypothetical protein